LPRSVNTTEATGVSLPKKCRINGSAGSDAGARTDRFASPRITM
jgi:hypothetical protein